MCGQYPGSSGTYLSFGLRVPHGSGGGEALERGPSSRSAENDSRKIQTAAAAEEEQNKKSAIQSIRLLLREQ